MENKQQQLDDLLRSTGNFLYLGVENKRKQNEKIFDYFLKILNKIDDIDYKLRFVQFAVILRATTQKEINVYAEIAKDKNITEDFIRFIHITTMQMYGMYGVYNYSSVGGVRLSKTYKGLYEGLRKCKIIDTGNRHYNVLLNNGEVVEFDCSFTRNRVISTKAIKINVDSDYHNLNSTYWEKVLGYICKKEGNISLRNLKYY